jgi:hypothetical protein
MNLTELLRNLGDCLGIIEMSSSRPEQAPVKLHTRSVTLAELSTEIRSDRIHTLAESPPDLSESFERIFEAAGIAPANRGWTVERLRRLLDSGEYRTLERSAAQQRLLEALKAEKVDVEGLVIEAVAQDRALDEFERSLRAYMEGWLSKTESSLAVLDRRIRELEDERAALSRKAEEEKSRLALWLERKRRYERELAAAVGYLIDRSVITVDPGGEVGPARPDS